MEDSDLHRPRPYCDWHEDRGDVLWWRMPISEAPYLGSPLDCGRTLVIETRMDGKVIAQHHHDVCGWPFTSADMGRLWWTPLPDPSRIEDQVPL